MTFFTRAAAIAAISLTITSLIGASTPGFAFDLDKSLKLPTALPVPVSSPTPEAAATPVPAEAADAVAKADTDISAAQSDDEYDSLAEAVAAQDTNALDSDLTCMAGAIYFEAKGEPLSGQLAVGEVIINRTKSGRFPKSICSVVTQPGQFSFVRAGRVPVIANNAAYRTAVAVARVAMADAWDSPAPDAMYFHARRVSPGWRMIKVAAIGNHVFYR
ncbi:MAG: cell wall hydrolase [Pseudomonadota bacterium]|jgi:spore germination cell wall hydrolase CwlJ-like protein|uniref:Cell wall hydrolyses involved in spore germination n=1 Tax=hydrothermal vent metagenome TaxID=652676 RepID=A0A160TF21_9ZZZZ